MPSVHLESDDGVSIRLVDVDHLSVDELTVTVGQFAQLGPTIIASPIGAQFGSNPRSDFADTEIEALHWVLTQLLGTDGDLDQAAPGVDTLDPVEFTTVVVVDGDDEFRFRLGETLASGMPSGLRKYWLSGEGAAKIRWGTDGDFTRCVSHLSEHVDDPKGTCANLHRDATGMWPGDRRNRKKSAAAADTEELRFNPFQPRAPKGSPDGGQWISDGRSSPGAVLPNRSPQRTPEEKLWAQRSKQAAARSLVVATPDDRNSRAGKLFGKAAASPVDEALDMLFPNEAVTTTIPFRSASRTKGEPLFDSDLVAETLADRRLLRRVDPRVLHATQPGITRDGVRYYLSNEHELTGRTYADQYDRGNINPVVYKNRRGQWTLLSGHHRAVVALIRGEALSAIVIDPDVGPPPRRIRTRTELADTEPRDEFLDRVIEFMRIPLDGSPAVGSPCFTASVASRTTLGT